MTSITLQISEERLELLQALAKETGLSTEAIAQVGLEEWLAVNSTAFSKAADDVLRKNAELYRRLA